MITRGSEPFADARPSVRKMNPSVSRTPMPSTRRLSSRRVGLRCCQRTGLKATICEDVRREEGHGGEEEYQYHSGRQYWVDAEDLDEDEKDDRAEDVAVGRGGVVPDPV